MKRAQKFVKRNWLLETLEHRCLMAADLQIGPLPVFEETIWMQADQVVAFQEDAFPAMVNERIANMEAAAPANTDAFVRALQESMGLPGFYNNEVALDELYAQYLTATDTQTIVTTSFDVAGVPADFEDTFTVKVNAQIERVGLESPDNLTSFVIALQTTMAGGQASEFINNDIALEELSNQYADSVPQGTLHVPTPVSQPAAQSIHSVNRARNEAWHLFGDSQGMSFRPAGEFAFEPIDWLPEDFVAVRSETTAEADVFLIQGLSKAAELEYRTLTVDIRQGELLSDKVTDEVTAGFVAVMGPFGLDWYSVVWQMETDPARPLDWHSTPFQQSNEQWIVRPGMHRFYYQQIGDDQWQTVDELGTATAFSAHHFVIEGDKLMAFGDDLIDGLDAPVRIVVNLTTGAVESFEAISEADVVPTNLEMQRLVDGAPLGRRTPGEIIYVDSFDNLQIDGNSPQPPQPDRLYAQAPNTQALAVGLKDSAASVQAAPLPETKQTTDEDEPLVSVTENFGTALNQLPVAGPIDSVESDDQTIIPDSDDARSTEEEASVVSGTLRDELLEKVDEQA